MRAPRAPQLAMLGPAMLLLVALIALPAVYVLVLSFTESTYGRQPVFVGLANYVAVWNDRHFWRALVNTLVVVNAIVVVELALGLAVAQVMSEEARLRWLTIAVLLTPYAISEVVAVVMWRFMLDPNVGFLALSIEAIGLPPFQWAINPVHGLTLVVIVSIWLHLPFTVMILYAAMLAIPRTLYEAAVIDGGSRWQAFRHITLPLVVPAMLIALIFRYIIAFRLFTEVWLLTGGGPARTTEVVAIYLYKQAFTYARFGQGAATAWIMVLVAGVFAAVYVWLLQRRSAAVHD
jgi:multiple sugar transport system permease protein